MTLSAQLPILGAAVFLMGMPHGALDHRAARELLEPAAGRGWLPVFLLCYLLAAGAMLLWWLVAPGAALGAFLLLATVHFGGHDSPSRAPVAVLARGATPPVIAAAAHRDELTTIFGWLAGEAGAALVPWLAGPGLLLWLCAAVATLAREAEARRRAELLGVTALFALLPPLLAFSAYFALLHSPRALAGSLRPGESLAGMLKSAVPCSLAAAGLAALGYLFLREQLPTTQAFVGTVFWSLAALTVPHMGLQLLSRDLALTPRNSPTAGARSSRS